MKLQTQRKPAQETNSLDFSGKGKKLENKKAEDGLVPSF
jgi:hypothetical protein